MSNYYSERLERFLTPGEVDGLPPQFRKAIRYTWSGTAPDPLYGRIRWVDPYDPKVILVHVVSNHQHDVHLFLNQTEILREEHRGGHDCVELLAVRIADALDVQIDERRVSVPDLLQANAKVAKPWSLLDFSETVDWPTRAELQP